MQKQSLLLFGYNSIKGKCRNSKERKKLQAYLFGFEDQHEAGQKNHASLNSKWAATKHTYKERKQDS